MGLAIVLLCAQIHACQRVGDLLQQQRIGLKCGIDQAELLGQGLLLRCKPVLEISDGVGQIVLLRFVLCQVDPDQTLSRIFAPKAWCRRSMSRHHSC